MGRVAFVVQRPRRRHAGSVRRVRHDLQQAEPREDAFNLGVVAQDEVPERKVEGVFGVHGD